MNSFVDAHTPSESPDASSSESSAGGDWESGEFSKTNENVDWPQQRRVNCSKRTFLDNKSNFIASTSTNTATTLSTTSTITASSTANVAIPSAAKLVSQNHFKSKSNNAKITSSVISNKDAMKKMRWLSNMHNDPDFRETFVNTVIIRPRQSFDSLDNDIFPTSKADTNSLSSSTTNGTKNDPNETVSTEMGGDAVTENSSMVRSVQSLESQSIGLARNGKPNDNRRVCVNSNFVGDADSFSSKESKRSKERPFSTPDDAHGYQACCLDLLRLTSSPVIANFAGPSAASSSLALLEATSVAGASEKMVEPASSAKLSCIQNENKQGDQTQRVNVDAKNGTSESPASLIAKRNSRYTPFTFREIRNELRAVMRQHSNKKC